MASSSFLIGLAEAGARSLLVAGCVAAGLVVLRARNVVAQKTAWMLVLAAGLLMPALAPLAEHAAWVPSKAILRVPRLTWPASHVSRTDSQATARPVAAADEALPSRPMDAASPANAVPEKPAEPGGTRFPAPAVSHFSSDVPSVSAEPARRARTFSMSAMEPMLLGYGMVSIILLCRVVWGAWSAGRLWMSAEPVVLEAETVAEVRVSRSIASPLTVGSGIVLPEDYTEWDAEKLGIVLAHERSHVRQGDFYLQLCASLYIAAFWFSPLGWWLKRKLSDLSETISDCAAVKHATSHAAYAQVLLEFAALPRPIPTGVAMARQGRLVSRIEQLLNESSFRQAFAGGRARLAAAVLLVPTALFAATALVRVEAAQQTAPPPPMDAPADPVAPTAPVAAFPAAPAAPQTLQSPAAPPETGTTVVPPGAPATPPAPPLAPGEDVFTSAQGSQVVVLPNGKTIDVMRLQNASKLAMQAQLMTMDRYRNSGRMYFRGRGWAYQFGDGNSYAYVTGTGDKSVHYSGDWYDSSRAEIEKARKVAHGDFLWFERDGKFYVLDDAATLAAIKPMQDRIEALGKQQEDLGRQQEELGRKQEELGRQQEQASVPTPDVSKELEQLTNAINKLNAQKGGNVTADQLGEIQSKLGDLQGKIGDIEGKIGEKQGELGEKQGELGEQQGKLGEEQGRLGEEQGRIAREMDGKVLTIIDESLKNGKARPVE